MDTILSGLTSPIEIDARGRGWRSSPRSDSSRPSEPTNPATARQIPLEFSAPRGADRAECGPSEAPSLSVVTSPPNPDWLVEPSTRIERRFAEFHRANPHVYAEFERRALQLHRAGARRIGAKAIAERIRWDIYIRTLSDDYKINNSYVSLYARLLIHRHPQLADVIELRRRKEAA